MTPIFANVGVPMIFIQWPAMLLALIPVIVIEALFVRRSLTISYRQAFIGTTKANLLTTFVGVPLAWLTMLALEFSTLLPFAMLADKHRWNLNGPIFELLSLFLGAAWIGGDDGWQVPLAAAILLIPSFYVSVWLERKACVRSWPDVDSAKIRQAVYRANLVSYGFLFLLACSWCAYLLFY